MRAEYEELLREILKVLLDSNVPLERRDLLCHPVGERMRPCRRDLESTLGRQIDDRAAQPHQLRAQIRRTPAHLASHLDHGLVQLGLHFLEHEVITFENLGDVRSELPRGGVDDLVLFLDAEGEGGGMHEFEVRGSRFEVTSQLCNKTQWRAINDPCLQSDILSRSACPIIQSAVTAI
jgi:hypothetical protein